MYWHAENYKGEIIVLTEREALIHFERNNVSQRMRLRFLGTSTGNHQKEAKKKIGELINAHRPDNYASYKREEQNVIDFNIREEHKAELTAILDEAGRLELEEAKATGVKQPRKSLHIHTPRTGEYSRDQIISSMGGMK